MTGSLERGLTNLIFLILTVASSSADVPCAVYSSIRNEDEELKDSRIGIETVESLTHEIMENPFKLPASKELADSFEIEERRYCIRQLKRNLEFAVLCANVPRLPAI